MYKMSLTVRLVLMGFICKSLDVDMHRDTLNVVCFLLRNDYEFHEHVFIKRPMIISKLRACLK